MDPVIKTALEVELASARAIDLAVAELIPTAGIKVGRDGQLTGVREAVDSFRKIKPHFFRLTVAQMSDQQYRAHKAESLSSLRKTLNQVELPKSGVPVLEMDARSYRRFKAATLQALARRGRK